VLAELLAHVGDDPALAGLPALRRLVAGELGLDDADALNNLPVEGLVPPVLTPAPAGEED